jgi:DNA-binding beta-propeller fold protein YncE
MNARRPILATLVSLCALTGGLILASAPALAAQGHIFNGSFGSQGSGEGQLSAPSDVAVNEATGDVYVADTGNDRVEYFTSAGAYAGQFNGSGEDLAVEGEAAPTGRFATLVDDQVEPFDYLPLEVAVDNDPGSPSYGDVYVADTGHEVIDKFSSTGAYIGQLKETSAGAGFGYIVGIAVDPNGGLWVYQEIRPEGPRFSEVSRFGNAVANEFLSIGELPTYYPDPYGSDGPGYGLPGFAVDSNENFYLIGSVAFPDGRPVELGAVKFNSSGEFVGDGIGSSTGFGPGGVNDDGIAVDLANNEVYIDLRGSVGRLNPTGALLEKFGSEHLTEGAGLAVTQSGEEVYVADQVADRIDRFSVEGPGRPNIQEDEPLEVAATTASLAAQVKPDGPDTTYYFQYGTGSCSAAPASCTDLPAPPGLDAGGGFNVQRADVYAQGLLPGTLYHFRVVATNELGTTEGPEATFTTQSAGSGFALPDGRVWELVSPADKLGAGFLALGNELGEWIQASEDGGAITYSANAPIVANPAGNESPRDSQILSTRVAPGDWESQDIAALTDENIAAGPGATDFSDYKMFSSDLSLGMVEPDGVTAQPPLPAGSERTVYLRAANGEYKALVTAANVPKNTKFGGSLHFEDATPDLSHIVLYSGVPLTEPGIGNNGLYEWAGGQLRPVSLMHSGEPAAEAFMRGFRHAISDDGSRVVFQAIGESNGEGRNVYLRDMEKEETLQLSHGEGFFEAGNREDSRVFFISGSQLGLFEVTSGKGEPLAGKLVDLAGGVNGFLGASEDGSVAYFVEGDNLYVVRYDEAAKAWLAPTFIATLDGNNDANDWTSGGETGISSETSRVSPDGRYLAFMSDSSLTGYDNRDLNSGVPDEEVFLYDAASGHVVCASCDPTGARPVGVQEPAGQETLINQGRPWGERWLAASLPEWPTWGNGLGTPLQPPYLSDSGRLFFNGAGPLVPADVNGTEDVYEYEPSGVGGCQGAGHGAGASDVYSEAAGGCVALISSGTSPEESVFFGASASGGDVFFLTRSRLTPADYDNAYDVYDAHECTPASPCAPPQALAPPPCSTGDACKPAPTPQPAIFGAPSSETFSGAGNILQSAPQTTGKPPGATRAQQLAKALRACRARARRKRAACERQAQARYGARGARAGKHLPAGTERRGNDQ